MGFSSPDTPLWDLCVLVVAVKIGVPDPLAGAGASSVEEDSVINRVHGCHFGPNSDRWSDLDHFSKMVGFLVRI